MNNTIGKRIEVLDKGYVELANFMPHPASGVSGDLSIVNAARISFLGESKGEEADKKLLFYMMKNGHTSPFEQVQFQFRLKAPLMTLWQLVRHRTLKINSQSGRYTPFEEDDFYVPDTWRKQSSSNKQGSEGTVIYEDAQLLNRALLNHYENSFALYEEALEMGVAKEEARLFLPGFAVYYTWVISIDAHNLMHLLKLRMDSHAQYEIKIYADAIYNEFFKPMLPWTAEAFEKYVLHTEESEIREGLEDIKAGHVTEIKSVKSLLSDDDNNPSSSKIPIPFN